MGKMQKHVKLTKREKLLVGAAITTACVAGYFGYKYFSKIKLEKLLHKDVGRLAEQSMSLEDSIDTLKAAMEETGRI